MFKKLKNIITASTLAKVDVDFTRDLAHADKYNLRLTQTLGASGTVTAVAHDSVADLVAVGTSNGDVLICGQRGIERRLTVAERADGGGVGGGEKKASAGASRSAATDRAAVRIMSNQQQHQKQSYHHHSKGGQQQMTQKEDAASPSDSSSSSSPDAVRIICFQTGENSLVSVDAQSVIRIWDFERHAKPRLEHTVKLTQKSSGDDAVNSINCASLPAGQKWLFLGLSDGTVALVDVFMGKESAYRIPNLNRVDSGSKQQLQGKDQSPSGASLSRSPSSTSFSPTTGEKAMLTQGSSGTGVVTLQLHPDDYNRVLVGYASGPIYLWDFVQRQVIGKFHFTYNVTFSSRSPGVTSAVSKSDSTLNLSSMSSKKGPEAASLTTESPPVGAQAASGSPSPTPISSTSAAQGAAAIGAPSTMAVRPEAPSSAGQPPSKAGAVPSPSEGNQAQTPARSDSRDKELPLLPPIVTKKQVCPGLLCLHFHPLGRAFVAGYSDGKFVFWDIAKDTPRSIHNAFSGDERGLLSADGSLSAEAIQTNAPVKKIQWLCRTPAKATSNEEPYPFCNSLVIFSGGVDMEHAHGVTVFEYRHPRYSFVFSDSGRDNGTDYGIGEVRRSQMLALDGDMIDMTSMCPTPWMNASLDPSTLLCLTTSTLHCFNISAGHGGFFPRIRLPEPLFLANVGARGVRFFESVPASAIQQLKAVRHVLVDGWSSSGSGFKGHIDLGSSWNGRGDDDRATLELSGGVPLPPAKQRPPLSAAAEDSRLLMITWHQDRVLRLWDITEVDFHLLRTVLVPNLSPQLAPTDSSEQGPEIAYVGFDPCKLQLLVALESGSIVGYRFSLKQRPSAKETQSIGSIRAEEVAAKPAFLEKGPTTNANAAAVSASASGGALTGQLSRSASIAGNAANLPSSSATATTTATATSPSVTAIKLDRQQSSASGGSEANAAAATSATYPDRRESALHAAGKSGSDQRAADHGAPIVVQDAETAKASSDPESGHFKKIERAISADVTLNSADAESLEASLSEAMT